MMSNLFNEPLIDLSQEEPDKLNCKACGSNKVKLVFIEGRIVRSTQVPDFSAVLDHHPDYILCLVCGTQEVIERDFNFTRSPEHNKYGV